MNGMATDSWPYVIAAYSVTWVVLIGYTLRLIIMTRRNNANVHSTRSRLDSQS